VATVPVTPPPSPATVIAAEVNELYAEVLGRNPSAGEAASGSAALGSGTSLAALRSALASGQEAQNDLNGLYQQVLGRPAGAADLTTGTAQLAGGSSLAAIQLLLAQSS